MKFARYLTILIIVFVSCTKNDTSLQFNFNIKKVNSYINNKTWFLNYLKYGDTISKSYIGKNAYYITFYNDSSFLDFDGMKGVYSISSSKDTLNLEIFGKTLRGNSVYSNYTIEHVGPSVLYLSFFINDSTKVTQIFTNTN
jgi:hypothetical protein